MIRQEGHLLAARCAACVKSGLRNATKPTRLKFSIFLEIIAAQQTYGPASVTVSFNKTSLRTKLKEIIPEGDPKREARRDLFTKLSQEQKNFDKPLPPPPVPGPVQEPFSWTKSRAMAKPTAEGLD